MILRKQRILCLTNPDVVGSACRCHVNVAIGQGSEVRVYVAEALERIKKFQPETTDDADFDF